MGHLTLQLARARGAHVTAVASADHAAFAKTLGADEVLDHHATDVTERPGRYPLAEAVATLTEAQRGALGRVGKAVVVMAGVPSGA